MRSSLALVCPVLLGLTLGNRQAVQQVPEDPALSPHGDPRAVLIREFAKSGVLLDLERDLVALDVRVLARFQPLEYLLVGGGGQSHESLFGTDVRPSTLNAALLALGVETGSNAQWIEVEALQAQPEGDGVDPSGVDQNGVDQNDGLGGPPQASQQPARVRYTIEPPQGDGFYLYAAWKTGDERFFYRVEDLIANVDLGRSMQRHRFVFLGSKMVRPRPDQDEEVFAADLEQNLINISFFRAGHTLLTAAIPAARSEDAWFSNHWLVPEEGNSVRLIFARQALGLLASSGADSALLEDLPEVPAVRDEL